jgi:membrane protease YdiL (CAAX protease family)
LGWGWGAWRWQWLAYTIPFAYAAIAYGFVWRAGFGGFPDPEFVVWTRKSLSWAKTPDWVVVCGYFALGASTGMASSVGHALGEEIGWRGFLSPRMTEAFGFMKGAVLTGIIWTTWHLPILLFADYNSGTPWWFGMSCFAVMVISMSIVMAWLRCSSGSLWTGAIFHASHNLFVQSFFTPATSARGEITRYAIDEFGFAVPTAALMFAIATWIFVSKSGGALGDRPWIRRCGISQVARQLPRVILLLPPDRSFDRVEITYVLHGPFGTSGRSITLNPRSRSVEIQASEEGKLADHIKLFGYPVATSRPSRLRFPNSPTSKSPFLAALCQPLL